MKNIRNILAKGVFMSPCLFTCNGMYREKRLGY